MKKHFRSAVCLCLVVALLVPLSACFGGTDTDLTALLDQTDTYKVYAEDFSEVVAKGQDGGRQMRTWREGFVTGNGVNGCVTAGSPYSDTLIYQNNYFIMPCDTIRENPDISGDLDAVRQMIVNGEAYQTFEPWYSVYCFHPGGQLRLTQEEKRYSDYVRWCDYETGEAVVKYTDDLGTWVRRTFTSRTDDATITSIAQSSAGSKVNLTLSFDDISKMYNFGNNAEAGMQYKKLAGENGEYLAVVAHYPSFEGSELQNGGFATLTYIVSVGGTRETVYAEDSDDEINVGAQKNPTVEIRDADAVYLITLSDRDFEMGAFEDFAGQTEYALVDDLLARCEAVAGKFGGDAFDYGAALSPSAAEQSEQFNRVSFSLGGGVSEALSNEDVLKLQRGEDTLDPTMLARVYNAGRYAMLACSGGNLIGRLYGMWTGEWGARWNGAFTMDANVNLQCSGMNSANVTEYGESYIRFVLSQIDDWKINALHNYGFTDAIQVPCNTDGTSAISVEYSTEYSFEYWNFGASWMLQPIYEYYQTFGNVMIETDEGEKRLLEDILLPLLTLQANFWDQMLTPEYYTDSEGHIHYEAGKTELADDEYYCIVPGYTPENMPANLESGRTANTAADIAAARKGFEMLIDVEEAIDAEGYSADIAKWQALESKLPPYLLDDTGALKEWAVADFEENNEHRHISHLYCAWPSNETQNDEDLRLACLQALENRNNAGKESEETQTHGWLHKGLVAARLKDTAAVEKSLLKLVSEKVYYNSLMTDHNTHRGSDCYCTDTSLGIVGVINEMLLYSDTGVIEAFPAMTDMLPAGEVRGLMAKTQAQVGLSWANGQVTVTILSNIDQTISVSCAGSTPQEVVFSAGEEKTFTFSY